MTNKTFFAAVLLVFTVVGTVQAQVLRFGVKAGASYPSTQNFDFSNKDGLDGLGFFGGGFGEYRSGPLAVTGEALFDYTQFSGTVNGLETEYYYSRVVLPIAFKYYVYGGLSLQLGGQLGILITAESETTIESRGTVRNDISLTTSSMDAGAFFGVGYELPLGLDFNLRYAAGISDFPTSGEKLSGPSLSVGYYIYSSGQQKKGTPSIKGKKWKRGRSKSGRRG